MGGDTSKCEGYLFGGELHNEVHQYLDFCITQMNGDFQVTNG
jgi:hypothetical protein